MRHKRPITSERTYQILINKGFLLENGLNSFLPPNKKFFIITDKNVFNIYRNFICDSGHGSCVLEPGEGEKNLSNIEKICREAVKNHLDRTSIIISIGGGVIGDMAAFAASIYMRGINFIQVPTTLLAMVDSAVGGKTGVDLPEGKNLIGTFWQPSLVLSDVLFLKTLPKREIKCGLSEIVKYGIILDSELFFLLEKNVEKLKKIDLDFYSEIIARACKLKAFVVEKDEKESGLRAILNYGHTFGHAIEKLGNFSSLLHGEAVAIGMRIAAKFAKLSGILSEDDEARQNSILDELELPKKFKADPNDVFNAMFSDKKVMSGKLRIVIPEKIGKARLLESPEKEMLIESIKSYITND